MGGHGKLWSGVFTILECCAPHVCSYQSFEEAIGQIFKDQEVLEECQAADGSIIMEGVVWAVTNLAQETDKWWGFVNTIVNNGFHKMQEMSWLAEKL